MYRTLRKLRIGISIAFLLLLTYAIVDSAFALTPVGSWLLQIQLVPAILGSAAVWLVLWVVITITYGRVYCSTVCPLGTVQDAVAYASRRLRPGSRYTYMPPSDKLRIAVAAVVAICLIAGITTVVTATDPFTRYSRAVQALVRTCSMAFGGAALSLLIVLAIAACAWQKGRIVCNTICPAGAFLALISRQALYVVDIDTDKCTHCNKCVDVCKSSCIRMPDGVVDNSRCVMCLDCTAVCPNSAIAVRRGRHRLSIPMMQKLTPTTTQNNETVPPATPTHT